MNYTRSAQVTMGLELVGVLLAHDYRLFMHSCLFSREQVYSKRIVTARCATWTCAVF